MFQALFNSLSGLYSFSRSLNTVSNNVTNMNTPGFRASDSFFSNIGGGRGTRIASDGLRTTGGDIRTTGNETDLAIQGDGYFVLSDEDGNMYYTRSGQFRFDDDDFLVDVVSGHRVMGYDNTGGLTAINRANYRTLAPAGTTGVHLQGNLPPPTGGTTPPPVTINTITVYDNLGAQRTLTATFTSTATPGTFTVAITDSGGATVGSGEVRFDSSGSPVAGFNTLTVNLPVAGGTQAIVFDFGTPGLRNGMTSNIGSPQTPTATVDDGHGVLGLRELRFNEKGVMEFVYSDSEKRTGPQVALATFSNESDMQLDGGRLISGATIGNRELGRPGEGRFGRIASKSLEMSNVDLTQEFAEMIIIQRGYQASSRVMSVSNEMLEQLYNSTRGG